MQNTQTGLARLDFSADCEQMVSVYNDVLISPLAGKPGSVVKMFVFQYSNGNAVTFSGFDFEGGVAPVLAETAGSSVTVWFACTSANHYDELKRVVVTAD